ncbi:MAG: CcmD family protein [Chitinophagaceae bacterium]
MRIMKRLAFILITLLSSMLLHAQGSSIGNTMRSNGRIYVVIAVILIILAGLILYLIRLDKKISKFEKEI